MNEQENLRRLGLQVAAIKKRLDDVQTALHRLEAGERELVQASCRIEDAWRLLNLVETSLDIEEHARSAKR